MNPAAATAVTCGVALAGLFVAFERLPQGEAARRQLWALNLTRYQDYRQKVQARRLPSIDRRFRGAADALFAPSVEASHRSGDYSAAFSVTLDAPESFQRVLHYTTDGSVPTRASTRYNGPIRIDSTTILRWRLLPADRLPGDPQSAFYRLDGSRQLPVLALTLDPVTLWNKYAGIYTRAEQRGRDFERPVHITLLTDDSVVREFEGDLRMHGGYSRTQPQKSFRLSYRADTTLPLSILSERRPPNLAHVVVRSSGVALVSRTNDLLSTVLFSRLGRASSPFAPVLVYLNGAFWGLYDLRPRIWEGFLDRFGPGEYELLTHDSERRSQWVLPIVGDQDHWNRTLAFFRTASEPSARTLDSAATFFDLDDITDYWMHGIYSASIDWPYNNAAVYRNRRGDGKWRFILWDSDGTFDATGNTLDHNTLAWSVRDRIRNDLKWNSAAGIPDRTDMLAATEVMRRLLEHPPYREKFILRMQVLLSTHYEPARVAALADSISSAIEPHQAEHFRRWSAADSTYGSSRERLDRFVRERPAIVRRHFRDHFGLGEEGMLRLDVRGPGAVSLGGVQFRDTVVAIPMLGRTRLAWTLTPDANGTPSLLAPLPDMQPESGTLSVRIRFTGRPGR